MLRVGDMVGLEQPDGTVEYIGVVQDIDQQRLFPVAVKSWNGVIDTWFEFSLVEYTDGVDEWPAGLHEHDDEMFSFECRGCGRDVEIDWDFDPWDFDPTQAYGFCAPWCCP